MRVKVDRGRIRLIGSWEPGSGVYRVLVTGCCGGLRDSLPFSLLHIHTLNIHMYICIYVVTPYRFSFAMQKCKILSCRLLQLQFSILFPFILSSKMKTKGNEKCRMQNTKCIKA